MDTEERLVKKAKSMAISIQRAVREAIELWLSQDDKEG